VLVLQLLQLILQPSDYASIISFTMISACSRRSIKDHKGIPPVLWLGVSLVVGGG
jgi:hypothetical protein